ncbi:synaptojanin, putative [Bodo saltans]|uniref:Synaptojanin, putative n=1 Tax=Bodo saltans TaxID=75058 RepID=A0A0S4J4J1_BODSA|nr:synaptojanin, putative [Bodo saltans]|eukprot:CUG78752.1 synaptojanin, putative [Bodo saltans]
MAASSPPQVPPTLGSSWFQYQAQLPPQTHLPLDRLYYYDTPTHVYVIGTNSEAVDYRLIKFTKDDEKLDVHFSDVYDREYMVNLVKTLREVSGGSLQTGKAKGFLGFVRFTRGYYMILVTKRKEVAKIGTHRVFHVTGTTMVSLCEPQKHQFLRRRSDEEFYRDLFLKFELDGAYLYYSHTYDMTNKLQMNMAGQLPWGGAPPPPQPHRI